MECKIIEAGRQKVYRLCYTTNALCQLEDKVGRRGPFRHGNEKK